MKGIITTNDPALVETLANIMPEWHVVAAEHSKLIEYFPLPPNLQQK